RAARPGVVLQAAPRPLGSGDGEAVRIGFTASRKVGNAVVRNRAKRRLRAAAAEVLARDGRPGTDYVLVARDGTGGRSYAELLGDLAAALRQSERPRPLPNPRPRPGSDRSGRTTASPGRDAARRIEMDWHGGAGQLPGLAIRG